MINKRLIHLAAGAMQAVWKNAWFQWIGLLARIVLVLSVGSAIQDAYNETWNKSFLAADVLVGSIAIVGLFLCVVQSAYLSAVASFSVMRVLRREILQKLFRLRPTDWEIGPSSYEAMQLWMEEIGKLEPYFGSFLSQTIYGITATLTIFILLPWIDFWVAALLAVFVLLIPLSIATVRTLAAKVQLRDRANCPSFGHLVSESLQELITLRICHANDAEYREKGAKSNGSPWAAMRGLTSRLNSLTVMDLLSFGGTTLGTLLSIRHCILGQVNLIGCFAAILLSFEFSLLMWRLGSSLPIAMDGLESSKKIFRLLDLSEPKSH